jgi:plastocyanin
MKKYIFGILLMIAVIVITVAACSKSGSTAPPVTPPTPPGAVAVKIQNFAFSPASVSIKAGQAVSWTNEDTAPHTVTDVDGKFDSSSLAQGGKYSYTFPTAGTYTYRCTIHAMMATATVVVTN